MTHSFGHTMVYALILLLLACLSAAAQNQTPTPGAEDAERRLEDMMTEPLSSEPEALPRQGVPNPVGPALDGVRGSALGPAPGAFGSDAGNPSDLRR